MSAGLNVTMKHLWPHLNIPKVCVHWDIQSHRWVKTGVLAVFGVPPELAELLGGCVDVLRQLL